MSGLYNSVVGGAKATLGHAMGNETMEQEGNSQCSHGKAQGDNCNTCRQSRSMAQNAKDKITGSNNNSSGNDQLYSGGYSGTGLDIPKDDTTNTSGVSEDQLKQGNWGNH